MSSKNTVKVKKVKIKVLEIEEVGNGQQAPPVDVSLAIGSQVGSVPSVGGGTTPIFAGEMTYYDPKKGRDRKIDMVEAVFSEDQGASNEDGNIMLHVSLTGTNEFIAPLVTTIPDDSASTPTHCIEITPSGSTAIDIKFLEPSPGEFVAYPALYFHTTEGIIDPGLGVRRGTGN